MAFEITVSKAPPVFDTLPALKVNQYTNVAAEKRIYTYARLYFLENSLAFNLSAFEQNPPSCSRITLALAGNHKHILMVTATPESLSAAFHKPNKTDLLWDAPEEKAIASAPLFLRGEDEQGWFWSVQAKVGKDTLQQAGIIPQVGTSFQGALYKYSENSKGHGASYTVADGQQPFELSAFNEFEIVGY